jgi:integrase
MTKKNPGAARAPARPPTRLTVKSVEAAGPERGPGGDLVRTEITDALVPGLRLVIQVSGSKSWAIRHRIGGKPAKVTLGAYTPVASDAAPAIGGLLTLDDARTLARDVLARLAAGEDVSPGAAKDDDALTFAEAACRYLARDAIRRKTFNQIAQNLGYKRADLSKGWTTDNLVLDASRRSPVGEFGARPFTSITKREIGRLVDGIAATRNGAGNGALGSVARLYSWAVGAGLAEINPAVGLKKPVVINARDRSLSDDELKTVLAALKRMDASPAYLRSPFVAATRMLVLTGLRRNEVAEMTWAEIGEDAITLPAERMKGGIVHSCHLTDAMRAILAARPVFAGCDYVFTTNGKTPISGWSKFLAALAKETKGMPHWTPHDLRRTIASGLAALGTNLPTIERLLAHKGQSFSGVAGIYQRHSFASEMRAALEAWSAHVATLEPHGAA